MQPLVAQIGWTHNLTILQRCKEPLEREFYIRMTRKFGWTKNVLMHQIENQSYRKYLLGQTNFDRTVTPELRAQAHLAVRDEYTFDFLELGDEHGERELEKALIARVEDFLRTMGGMFAFVGSQFRLEVDGDEYFIDLLLFHRRLRCLVAVDLKIGKFRPEFVGKMQFYLTALDRTVRETDESPSIGNNPVQGEEPDGGRIRAARRSQADRRGHLPHQPAVTERTGRTVTFASGNRPTAGYRRMSDPGGLDACSALRARHYDLETAGIPAPLRRCFDPGEPRPVTARGDVGIRRAWRRDE